VIPDLCPFHIPDVLIVRAPDTTALFPRHLIVVKHKHGWMIAVRSAALTGIHEHLLHSIGTYETPGNYRLLDPPPS
jgi:hypothetical protein